MASQLYDSFTAYQTPYSMADLIELTGDLPEWESQLSDDMFGFNDTDPIIIVTAKSRCSKERTEPFTLSIEYLGTLSSSCLYLEFMATNFSKGLVQYPACKSKNGFRSHLKKSIQSLHPIDKLFNRFSDMPCASVGADNTDSWGSSLLSDSDFEKAQRILTPTLGDTAVLYDYYEGARYALDLSDPDTVKRMLAFCMMLTPDVSTGVTYRPWMMSEHEFLELARCYEAKKFHLPENQNSAVNF